MKISLIKKMDPTCLLQQFLSYSSIYSWLLNSCMPHFPNLFFLASSQTLGSCQICYLQLLFPKDCCFSFTHTHTLLHIPLRERGERLHDFPFSSPSSWFCLGAQGSFTFSSAILSLVHFWIKLTVTCTSPSPVSFISWSGRSFPCCWAPPAVLLCFYTKGDSVRISVHHCGCCPCRGSTLAVLHIEDLSQHILRLHATTDVKSKNVFLSSGLDAAQ